MLKRGQCSVFKGLEGGTVIAKVTNASAKECMQVQVYGQSGTLESLAEYFFFLLVVRIEAAELGS